MKLGESCIIQMISKKIVIILEYENEKLFFRVDGWKPFKKKTIKRNDIP